MQVGTGFSRQGDFRRHRVIAVATHTPCFRRSANIWDAPQKAVDDAHTDRSLGRSRRVPDDECAVANRIGCTDGVTRYLPLPLPACPQAQVGVRVDQLIDLLLDASACWLLLLLLPPLLCEKMPMTAYLGSMDNRNPSSPLLDSCRDHKTGVFGWSVCSLTHQTSSYRALLRSFYKVTEPGRVSEIPQ
ncbi:uncharacterized protein IWZ02DRAFT_165062 [Phyllosticta citriasiana]|uniref:Uncharacterized protein n=1 Tax=Phyllosticta citriasiana TaxID=595635 RepID=A0ABR1KPY3_9PEZI